MTESMTDEDLMLNAWEELADGRGWHEMPRQYRFEAFEAGWKAASPQPQQWIKCSDRLPTRKDADCNGDLWVFANKMIILIDVEDFKEIENYKDANSRKILETVFWMPTNLKRPEPPKE